ncbi:MAG: hypothetical protein GTO02_05665 [Candidatus Dadabacteria bacterium]|nr:hypothetical protein [Candidatus Dadabacteria bacterium]NIQ13894.1 hypothetical protein [Candidatus Dadabacteria bacterium]
MKLSPETLEKITLLVCVKVAVVLVLVIGLISSVALFGPKIAPLMRFLPW